MKESAFMPSHVESDAKEREKMLKTQYEKLPIEKQYLLGMDIMKLDALREMDRAILDRFPDRDMEMTDQQRSEWPNAKAKMDSIQKNISELRAELVGRYGEELVVELLMQLRKLKVKDARLPRDERTHRFEIRPDMEFFR